MRKKRLTWCAAVRADGLGQCHSPVRDGELYCKRHKQHHQDVADAIAAARGVPSEVVRWDPVLRRYRIHERRAAEELRGQEKASADARVTRAMVKSSETEQGKPGAMRPEWYRKHPCEIQGCPERVTHGNTTPDVTIWYCQPHAADEIARNARNG